MLAVTLHPVAAQAVESHPVAPDGTVTFDGHGYGHGRGLSQWGAYGAATRGLTTAQILGFYYPGTSLTGQPNTDIVVRLSTSWPGELRVDQASGLALRSQSGTVRLPTTSSAGQRILSWRLVSVSGGMRLQYVDAGQATWRNHSVVAGTYADFTSSAGAVRLVRPDYTRREYRGALGVRRGSDGVLTTVNVVRMESYLRAVVPAEMPASWPAAALGAQSVAARTYASHQRYTSSGPIDTCDTTACQVYAGRATYSLSGSLVTNHEHASSDAAIARTANQVVITGGAFSYAFTQFGASNGGWSVAGSQPYLVSRHDPYDGVVPSNAHDWTTTVRASTIQAAYPRIGTFRRLTVLGRDGRGEWGGRVTSVRVEGSSSSVVVTADQLRFALGLRSTWWTTAGQQQPVGGMVTDVTGDGYADVWARRTVTGTLYFFRGRPDGTFEPARAVGSGWDMHDTLISPGDVTGDGIPDIYARERGTGQLWLYPMNRSGEATSRRVVGTGWDTIDMLVPAGDVTRDGRPDLYGRVAEDGTLRLYPGSAGGGFSSRRQVGTGWHPVDAVVGVGDISRDGIPDLVARRGGHLYRYTVRSDGTLAPAVAFNSGWAGFDTVVGGRDSAGAFLLVRDPTTSNGRLLRYPISASGLVSAPRVVGSSGWNIHAAVL
ncbi:SpoIID/LytB domain protein [Beutenbergia cavernae DSM 12333]|uniref:SpoIID/LytB domain protein n=1 Tax=Beutenbergia cavernae (strain ATCC BAA-8 / DSM 12333 / CCUG 43141 / JCM 11478 / NBRC 16432 / NCIMB 13614 / HKI 0122) TaxID=471853 RepID=C5C135_BEUC1|nr:SpoIID/LytB domain protein [Beutenbergia cavernae DSM 12333]